MNNLIQSIHSRHIDKNFYIINDDGKIQNFSKKQENSLSTARKLMDLTKDEKIIPSEKRVIQSCAYDYMRWIQKKGLEKGFSEDEEKGFNLLMAEAFLTLMGNTSPDDTLVMATSQIITHSAPWYAFIQANHIHYSVHSQQISFHKDVINQICISGKWINWNDLEIAETKDGYDYKHNGEIVFVTDKKQKLKGYFYAGDQGIIKGSPIEVEGAGQFFSRPSTGKHWINLYASIKDPRKVGFGMSHAYLGLEDANGKFSYAGQYGLEDKVSFFDLFTMFGKKKMGVETPDRYSSLPLAQHDLKELRIEITQEEYEKLLESIKVDKQKGIRGSYLKGNCANYVKKKLNLIGIKAKTQMSTQQYLFRTCLQLLLPKPIGIRAIKWLDSIPSWAKKASHFHPTGYPINILWSAAVILLGGRSDVSVINAVFRPWKVKAAQPIVFAEWMKDFEKTQKEYAIIKAKTEDSTEIGQGIKETSASLGFNESSEGRLHLKTHDHIIKHKIRSMPMMLLGVLYDALSFNLKNFLSKSKEINKHSMLMYLHTLMNQKFITPYHFYNLRDSIDHPKKFNRELESILTALCQKNVIDQRSFIYLKQLLKSNKCEEVLHYIIAVSLLAGLNTDDHFSTIEKIITPTIQRSITDHVKKYQTKFHFDEKAVKDIQSFASRVLCYEWAEKITDEESKNQLLDAIKSLNEKEFVKELKYYFIKQKNEGSRELDKKILDEMIRSIDEMHGENPFIYFAHMMQTQSRIKEIDSQMAQLQIQIEGSIENSKEFSEITLQDLKHLHQNLGILLDCDAKYSGSNSFTSLMIGNLRTKWQNIDDLLAGKVLPSQDEMNLWPDAGLGEIKLAPVEKSHESAHVPAEKKKKIFFAYCSWGDGHRSMTKSLSNAAKDKYRVTSCDLPDEVLIERDPLFNSLGKEHSVATLYNTLMAGNYRIAGKNILDIVMKLGSAPTPQKELDIQKELIRCKLLQENPDVVVATYEKHSALLLEVANELGIPFVQVYSDLISHIEPTLCDGFKKDPTSTHQRILAPNEIPEMNECFKEAGIAENQYSYIGYPIRKEFFKEQNLAELKEKYGVKPDQKVVLCMNGGNGGDNPWSHLLANAKNDFLGPLKVIVVCGKNQEFFEKVKKLKPKDVNVEFIVKGYVEADDMAEICTLADMTITKPGGGTIAENLLKRNFLLLDTRTKSLRWEIDAANALTKNKRAARIESEKAFLQIVKDSLALPPLEKEKFDIFSQNFEENFLNEMQTLINASEEDVEFTKKRQEAQSLKNLYPFMTWQKPGNNFEQNLANLLLLNERINPEKVIPSLKSSIHEANGLDLFVKFNIQTSNFEVTEEIKKKDLEYAIDVIGRHLKEGKEIPLDILEAASKMVLRAYKTNKNKYMQLLDQLASLDFLRLSKKISEKETIPVSFAEIQDKFLTKKAAAELQSWISLKTSQSRRNPAKHGDQRMLSEKDVLDVFVCNPQEFEFVKKLHLHRKASAFNHFFEVQDHHLCILFEGKITPISELKHSFKLVNDRIRCVDEDVEYTYTYDKGLSKIAEGQHPVEWRGEIPLFKHKDRKTADYRLEVMTTIGAENHGWIRLKDPSGNVYSMGEFWHPDYQLENILRCTSLPGYVKGAGDLQEFLGKEADWKRTKISLTEEQFNAIKELVIQIQEKGPVYNLINSNCVSFVGKVLKKLGVNYQFSESPLFVFLLPNSVRKFLIKHENVRKITKVVTYPLALLQNLLLSVFGMRKRNSVDKDDESGFSMPVDIFSWNKGALDHPQQLRLVQELLEENYGEKGTDKINHFKKFAEEKKAALVGASVLV